jgi:hypothetical protein
VAALKRTELTLGEVARVLEASFVFGGPFEERRVAVVCGMDLMSDVLSLRRRAQLLLTGLTTAQAVRTAELSDIPAVCYVDGKRPAEEAVDLARENGIALMATRFSMFTACGKLAAAGLVGGDA